VVRVIAPFVNDKRFDPAVVVIDDSGQYAISLLSGHIGGANELTEQISSAIGAKAVITTATDIVSKPAADVLATKLGLAIEPFSNIKNINAAIANNEIVDFFIETTLDDYEKYMATASNLGIVLKDIAMLNDSSFDSAVLITNKTYTINKPHIYLRLPNLSVGIGCRRGTPLTSIWQSVDDACASIGRSLQSIQVIGSTILKQDEEGLLQFIAKVSVPVKFFNNQEIQACIALHKLEVSRFVEKEIGVGNICEAAALLAGQSNKLLLPKTKYQGVTVAIAEVN
ncbi:MAG: cobalamin biosynthesis protein, partial [Negativicutes bacterium]|nr:cobalamin biosynthesis protein [Negativicutes bacterium]